MTRTQALDEAINLIQKSSIGKVRKAEILHSLELCKTELPFAKWTKEAVFDACDQFVLDHGRIRLVDFDHAGLPSHPTIQNRFGMSAKIFRDTYYPLPESAAKYSPENATQWNEKFIAEFHRIGCTSGQHYNHTRDKTRPTFQTLARINEVGGWTALLYKLNLSTYTPERPKMDGIIVELGVK